VIAAGGGGQFDDLVDVAGDVADQTVHLGECDGQFAGHGSAGVAAVTIRMECRALYHRRRAQTRHRRKVAGRPWPLR
jgi:hypothetical protein